MRLYFLLLLLQSIILAAPNPSQAVEGKDGDAKFTVQKLSRHISIITSNPDYTNIGYVHGNGANTIIDPGMRPADVVAFLPFLKSVQKDTAAIILNTHNHSDHTTANEALIKHGARLQTVSSPNIVTYTVTSHASTDRIFHHPTDNIIFIGDILENGWHPTFYAGGIEGFNKAIGKLLTISDDKTLFIPGHGHPMSRSALKAAQENTNKWAKEVERQIAKGRTVTQMMASKRLNAILQTFNTTNRQPFLPERAHRRFIERTVALITKQ